MQMYVNSIEAHLKETGEKYWADPEFLDRDESLYLDADKLPSYATDKGEIDWRRPHEIYTVAEPKMGVSGLEPSDVKQGILGDCWLLSSFMLLAN